MSPSAARIGKETGAMASRRKTVFIALLCIVAVLLSPELLCFLTGLSGGDDTETGFLAPPTTSDRDIRPSRAPQTSVTLSSPCLPVRHVAFLKVHKAGSTTLANVLQRFALRNDLNLVLPNKSRSDPLRHCLGYGRHFDDSMVIPLPPDGAYHILSSHVVYNRTVFRKLMPPNATYVAIVREPEERFISAAFYYGLVSRIERSHPEKKKTRFVFKDYLQRGKRFQGNSKFYNAMAFDFGVPEEHYHDDAFLDDYLAQVARDFRLVLLTEYFDESLVLLRRHLCWGVRDILYTKLNTGARGGNREVLLTEEDRRRLHDWQNADFRIYEYFVPRFWAQVHKQGPGFFEELFYFKSLLRSLNTFCARIRKTREIVESHLTIPKSPWSDSFEVSSLDCRLMAAAEPKLVDFLIKRQWDKLRTKQK